jgi:outer membrane receptor protein involved in Fe transport
MHIPPYSRDLRKVVRLLCVGSSAAWLCSAATGAAAAATAAASAESDTLADVVITATKRESTVQDTPISVTAVSAEELTDRGISSFIELSQSIPGISMRSSGSGQTEFEMRGLQSAGGSSSTVGFYLGEIPLSSPASAQNGKVVIDPNLYDLGRVEVLRGPQGTLYGSGSMGGTVKLVPHAPELGIFDASGETIVSNTSSGGSINTAQNGMVNLPIGDNAALRIVGSLSSTSGWVQRIVIEDGEFPAGTSTQRGNVQAAPVQTDYSGSNAATLESVRGSFLWKPTEQFTVEAMAMYQLSKQDGPSATDSSGINPVVSGPEAHYQPYDVPEPYYDRFTLGSVTLTYDFGGFTATSATGFWNRNSFISQDASEENETANGLGTNGYDVSQGGLGPNSPATWERDYTSQISEELRISSTGDGPFQWLGGFFYSELNSTWGMESLQPEATKVIGSVPNFGGDANPDLFSAYEPATIKQNAFFGEISYKFNSFVKATAGLRRYSYTTTQTDNEGGAELGSAPGPYGAQSTFDAVGNFSVNETGVDPKFDISLTPNRDLTIYATAAKGFRPGGVNQFLPTNNIGLGPYVEGVLQCKFYPSACPATGVQNPNAPYVPSPQTFLADSVWNYELGEKAQFLDRRLTLNADVYYEDWQNPQLLTNAAGFGYTVNGSDAHIYGGELEMRALLTDELTLSVNFSYDHATFQQNNAASGYLAGQEVPDTPKVTSGQTLSWKHPVTDSTTFVGSIDNFYVGSRIDIPYGLGLSIYGGATQAAIVNLASYDLTNVRAGIVHGNWTAALFANNVFNKKVLLDPQPQIDLALLTFQRYTVNQPLTVGIDLNYRFGGK